MDEDKQQECLEELEDFIEHLKRIEELHPGVELQYRAGKLPANRGFDWYVDQKVPDKN
jgi:hypothetical protein